MAKWMWPLLHPFSPSEYPNTWPASTKKSATGYTEANLLRNHGEQASQIKMLLAQPEQQTCNHECPQIKSRSLLVNMPDLVQKHSGYSQLWPLWPAHSQNRAGSCICQIRLPASDSVSFLQRRPRHIVQNRPRSDLIWMAWSGLGQTDLVQKQAGVQESLGPVLAQNNWPATRFSLSDSVAFFHRWPRSLCAKPAQI